MLSPEEKKAHHHRVRKNEDRAHADLLRRNRQYTRKHDRQTVRFAKENGADGAILAAPAYICAPEADIERFFSTSRMQPTSRLASTTIRRGSRAISLGSTSYDLQAPELRRAQGIHRARGPGAQVLAAKPDVSVMCCDKPESGSHCSDHEPRRAWHCEHDRQHRPCRARDHLDSVDELPPGRGFQEHISAHVSRSCISPIPRSNRLRSNR